MKYFQEVKYKVFWFSVFILFSLGNVEQLSELIVETESIPDDLKPNLNIDLKLEVDNENEKREILSLNVSINSWKSRILDKYNGQKITYIITEHTEADDLKKEKFINVTLDEQQSPHIMIEKETKSIIKAKTFMKFKVVPLSKPSLDPADIAGNYEILKNSFKHELTSIGKMSLSRLEKNLSISHLMWMGNYNNYAAPLVTFCQSSGSGKSKLSIECLKSNPGFYLVFRESSQTGYPRMNSISQDLLLIINGYADNSSSQEDLEYNKSTVGKILNYFACILVSYVRNICALVGRRESLGSMSLKDNLDYSINEIGSLFLENETVQDKFSMISHEEMEKLYTRFGGNLSVKNVSQFFYSALKFPEQCLDDINSHKEICVLLCNRFEKYPFFFVLDEADIIANIKKMPNHLGKEVSGLEILRRALGYINSGTAALFLTLGTKSDVVDLNPPVIDFSARFLNRKLKLDPITLTSNSNIFSKDFPIYELSPTFALLRNPFMFKFISTLGHGLWSAYPFSQIITTALMKLKNGSADTKGYFLPVWMVRTGLAANPLHVKANSLVAGHMATIHDVQDNLKNFIVSYPSEPILAIASKLAMSENQDVPLFDILKDNTEAVSLDIGRFAEVFGAMIILRAIDRTPNFAKIYDDYKYHQTLNEIKSLTPSKFHSLWEKETQLLEASSVEPKDQLTKDTRYLKNYNVYNVGDFLKTLTNVDNLDKFGIPKTILNGIINATHFVTLMRDNTGFKVGDLNIKPEDLPTADDRISNTSRNIIDTSLLKIGLLKQCGFAMPANYYGLDFILPVCLENDDLTFIGIQIKRSDANMSEDVHKMRSRLHLVKCPNNCIDSAKDCDLCLSKETLQNIHGNHLSLLLSLDDDNKKLAKFANDIKFRSGISDPNDCEILLNTMMKSEVPKNLSELTANASSNSFLKPLVQKNIKIKDDVGMAVSLWNDKLVKLPQKSKEVVDFRPDPWVHRQYTLMTRGWNVFSHLFSESETIFKIANGMTSNDGLFRHVNQRSDPQLVRSVVYDMSPSYVQYSDELLAMKGKGGSKLEALDEEEMKLSQFVRGNNPSETSKLALEMDKKLVISPPESPKNKK